MTEEMDKSKKHAEILAPAGGWEQLTAAVRSGADAVYLGQKAFNARMGADNFDDLKSVVSFCHARGVKVYVTFNTLWKQSETADAVRALQNVALSGADAILATDMGTVYLARACCPQMKLHASTQMTVHSPMGVRLMRDLGFTRCVLAREMSREEIREAAAEGLETEVFVHGALCMSVSGQCFLSSVLGGRSGNRGRCAQPCRLNFTSGGRAYVLSLKDLSLMDRIGDLESIGVDSLKIEGRLKRPEYVSAAVTECRRARDGEKPDMETLEKVFSRGGFTQGYYDGKRNAAMFGIREKEDEAASREVLGRIRDNYRREYPHVPLDMVFTMAPAENASLCIAAGDSRLTVTGPVPENAIRQETGEDAVRAALEKLGGTPFRLGNLTCRIAPSLFLSASAIGKMRREAAEGMLALLSVTAPVPFSEPVLPAAKDGKAFPRLRRVFLSSKEQLSDELLSFADRVYLPLGDLSPSLLEKEGSKVCGRIGRFLFGKAEDAERERLRSLCSLGLREVSVSSPNGIAMGRENGVSMYGECTLGIMNGCALAQYADLGLTGADLTFECGPDEMKSVPRLLPLGCAVYGRLPLMSFRSCPLRGFSGCGNCPGHGEVRDRYGEAFPIQCHGKQYSVMLNPRPLYMGDKKSSLPEDLSHSFYFTSESAAECAAALRRFSGGLPWDGPFTRALYTRGVL